MTAAPAAPPLLSPKQLQFLLAKDKRINILEGSIRSGKTIGSLWKWGLFVAGCPKAYEFLMVGKTITSLKRNCLLPLRKMVGKKNFSFNLTTKQGLLFGRVVHLEGANDERADGKIHGMTLGGAYCDEVTLYPESFIRMLLGRLSLEGAKAYFTCNPEYPKHYIKTQFIDNKNLDCAVWHFFLEDNPYLAPLYVQEIKKEYAGTVYFKRFILGLWCQAEGVIYPLFNTAPEKIVIEKLDLSTVNFAIIGVDFGGNKSGDAMVAVGYTDKGPVILAEQFKKGIKTPAQLEDDFVFFVQGILALGVKVYDAYVDSAEQTLKAGLEAAALRARIPIEINNAKKSPIVDRIRLVNLLISRGRFRVLKACGEVIGAFQAAVWNNKKQDDERLDDGKSCNIDVLDATEYALEPEADNLIAGE